MNRSHIVRTTYAPDTDRPVNTNWRASGACADEDPDLFFPIGNNGPALLQTEEAKAVCRDRCPVMDTCLTWALEHGQEHGVWGGLGEDERRALKRRTSRNRARNAA
ncbi:WhiB family transcriptional regulator [Streptomyces sp. NPDC005963]|uniref:WhiB family transcriptional regulator n=1 Tax=Streptomyces sp. NPDC005963 TaxID=3156721 RepID=UPI0033C7BBC9